MAPAPFSGYAKSMKKIKPFLKTNGVGFVLGAALLTMLTANTGYADGLRVGIIVAPPVVVVAPPVVVVQDDYVYYPDYGIYYNSHRHQYANWKTAHGSCSRHRRVSRLTCCWLHRRCGWISMIPRQTITRKCFGSIPKIGGAMMRIRIIGIM